MSERRFGHCAPCDLRVSLEDGTAPTLCPRCDGRVVEQVSEWLGEAPWWLWHDVDGGQSLLGLGAP